MGNRVSTSQTAFSLEELESLARAPSLVDLLPAELQQRSPTNTTAGAFVSGAHRKESWKAELERLYTEYDTSLHVLRCVLDRTSTRRQQRSCSQAPVSAAAAVTRSRRTRSAAKATGSHSRKVAADGGPLSPQRSRERQTGTHRGDGGDAAERSTYSNDVAVNENEATGAAAPSSSLLRGAATAAPRSERRRAASRGPTVSVPSSSSKAKSADRHSPPGSWLFRDVSVQPFNLSRAAEVKSSEVYILIIVQRVNPNTTASSSNGTTPATTSINTASAAAAGAGASANQEWPRDMAHVFSPRGLTTPFSTDMTRPTLASGPGGAGLGPGGGGWYSPSATPRTNSSTSNRPTPRSAPPGAFNANASAAGNPQSSPLSISSQPTPRNTGFHFSVHLLTGKQADATTAAAGLFTARAVERLFLDNPDFDRRLFYNVNADRTEALVKAFSLQASPDVSSGRDAAAGAGRRAGRSSSSTTTATSKSARSSSSRAATATTARGETSASPTATAGPDTSGAVVGRESSASGGAAGGGTALHQVSASIEACRELRRELLALLRPAPVVAPRFDKRGANAVSPSSTGEPAVSFTSVSSNTAELYSVNAVYRVLNGVRLGTPRWMHYNDLASPGGSARYSLAGAAGSGPGGSISGGGGAAGGGATVGWHLDPLPAFRPPPLPPARRSGTVDGGAPSSISGHSVVTPVPTLNFSGWLQGPQPLDVHRAAPAAAGTTTNTASASATAAASAGGGGGGGGAGTTTPRIGRVLRRPWTPSSATATSATASAAATTTSTAPGMNSSSYMPPPPLPLPTLPLGTLGGAVLERRTGAGTPLDVAEGAATTTAAAPPSLSTGSSFSAPSPPPASTSPATVTTAAGPGTPGFSLSLPLGMLRQLATTGSGAVPATPGAMASVRSATRTTPRSASSAGAAMAAAPTGSAAERAPAEWPPPAASPVPALPSVMIHHHHHHPGHQRVDSHTGQLEGALVEPDKVSGDHGDGGGGGDAPFDDGEDFNEVHTQQERAQRLKAAQPEVTEVLPYLFVGGEDAARDRAQLLRKGITHVVNTVSWCLDNFYPDLFRYLALSLSDAADEPIFSLFALVNAFIEDAAESGHGRVFVHCQQGVSRSCTFIMAYVMWKLGLCYDRAYELVRARRNVCSPNLGFLMNLRLWEAQLSTPLLNAVYAFAPYTATALMPLSYQLVAYFDCETASTTTTNSASTGTAEGDAAAVALLTDSTGSADPLAATATPTTSLVPPSDGVIAEAEKEAHLQLRSDVLTRAVNMASNDSSGSTASAAATLSLDPRLAYLLLFAPTRRISISDATPGTTTTTTTITTTTTTATASSSNTDSGSAEGSAITGCVVVGPKCVNVAYTTQALAACNKFLRSSFYHGATVTSRTNTGRVFRFSALRPVRLLFPTSPHVGAPSSSSALTPARYSELSSHATAATAPVAAVSPEEAQRQITAKLGSRAGARVAVAPLREWDPFFAPAARLGTTVTQNATDEARLDASEATRRHARLVALNELDLGAAAAAARSAHAVGDSRPASRTDCRTSPVQLLPDAQQPAHPHQHVSSGAAAPSHRMGRHTLRTPRHTSHTTGGGASTAPAAMPGASMSVPGNGGSTSLRLPLHAVAAAAAGADAAVDGSALGDGGAQLMARPERLALQRPAAPLATTSVSAATATEAPAVASTAASHESGSAATLLPRLPLGNAAQPHPQQHASVPNGADGGGGCGSHGPRAANYPTASPVTVSLAAGESFAYAFPFTADTRVIVSDLDDLDTEQCYALGFQERMGATVYLWRGAQASEEAADVVQAFAQNLVGDAGDSAEPTTDAVIAALESRAWCTCFIHLPELDAAAAAGGGSGGSDEEAAPVLMRVRVLYVDEGEEPKEFFTLL